MSRPGNSVRRHRERVYVKVNSDFDSTGYMQPKSIRWGEDILPIEKIEDFRPASAFCDLPGDCYTVVVKGQEKHLFFERSDSLFPGRVGRWFVEVDGDRED